MEEILKELSKHFPTIECSFFRGKRGNTIPIEIQRTFTTPKETAELLWQDMDSVISDVKAVFVQLEGENTFHDGFFAYDVREEDGEKTVVLRAEVYEKN